MTNSRSVVLIPIKNFGDAKSRLRPSLSPPDLEPLSRELARGVINAWSPRTCVVLCDNDVVASFARSLGAEAMLVSSEGLNSAVHDGYLRAAAAHDQVIISHADLAAPAGLGAFEFGPGLTIVTDRHGRGTNVMALPPALDFQFAYGDDSAARHRREGERCGLTVTTIDNSPWGLDIDEPEDLGLRNM